MSKPTIFDVANLAGVSIKTVSRVVNQELNVRETTRERVGKAIARLGYQPNQSARNLASHRSHLIGLVYDDPAAYAIPSGGYILDLQQGALRACRAALRELVIHPCNYRKKDVAAELKLVIAQTRVSGIILAAPLSNMPKIVRAISATGTPCVRLSPGDHNGKQATVGTNDSDASAELTRYLAGLGHKRIAYITGDPEHKAVANRFAGYQVGLRDSGLRFRQGLVADGDNSFDSGVRCGEKLLARKQRPTAIIAANDDMAAGVIRAAHRSGIEVPTELSVAGFDDIALARQVDPALTTIRQPLVRMAERAALMLMNGDEGEATISAEVKIRESTGPSPE